jgi:hypothetical protein
MLFYRSYLLLIFLVCITSKAKAQSADSISITFPKIIVKNKKNEILLIYDDNRKAYEVPGATFEGPVSFKAYVDTMAAEMGIQYATFTLGGIFIYKYPNRYRTVVRPYFIVDFTGYRDEKSFDQQRYKWFSVQDAVAEIPYPASAKIVEKVLKQPKTVWGAMFEEYGYTNPVDKSKIKFRILEDFYALH